MAAVHPKDILCNYLARIHGERTRYGQLSIMHVSDLLQRKDLLYIERTISPAPVCHHLARMYQGFMWEKEIMREFARYGYVHEPEYHARVVARLRYPSGREERREYTLLAHPDFVLNPSRPAHIIEMKTTRWGREEVISIVQGQYRTFRAFGVEVPQPFGLDENDEAHFPAFFDWILQCAWYRWYFGWRRRIRFTLFVIYRDAIAELELPDRALRAVWESFWELNLKKTIVALDLARRYSFRREIPFILAALDHLHITGLMGYISNDEILVEQGWTLPYIKLTTHKYPDDQWIFGRWRVHFGIRNRPPLANERFQGRKLSYAEAKRWQIDFLMTRFMPHVAELAQFLIQRYDIPAVDIIRIEPVGVSRSPLRITEEAFEEKLRRIEELLKRAEARSEPGFTS